MAAPAPDPEPAFAAGPTAFTPEQPGPRRRRGRGVWLAALAVTALLVGAGVVVAWALTGDDQEQRPTASDRATTDREDPAEDATAEDSTAEDSGTPDASEDPTPSTAEPSESPSAVAGSGARCWDGTTATDVDACPYPSGQQGLEWVFPSMAKQSCTDLKAERGSPRVQLWECYGVLADGSGVRLNYSQWDSVSQGHDHFSQFLGEPAQVSNRFGELALYRWNGRVDGDYERAVLDAREPFSVAVFVARPELRDAAFDQLVRLRPGSQFRGVPTG